jgi:Lar family restriction alleviation protein
MKKNGLLHCPFCGYPDSVVTEKPGVAFVWVECQTCGARGPDCDNEDAAEAAWNSRAKLKS